LSRHGHVQRKRSKFVVLVAAGAFTVASAGTATAVAWPSGSASASSAALTTVAQAQVTVATNQIRHEMTLRAEEIRQQQAAQAAPATAQAKAAKAKAAQARAAKIAAAKKAAAAQAAARAAARAAAAKKKAEQAAASAQPSGSPEQIAAAMLSQYGWSSGQMSCLQPLWDRESGWSVSAYNASSGAYGIPQALPGYKMASVGSDWQTSAYTQIKWGLGYITDVYGSPCGAWAHEVADGWY
jgi:hypothetical protein